MKIQSGEHRIHWGYAIAMILTLLLMVIERPVIMIKKVAEIQRVEIPVPVYYHAECGEIKPLEGPPKQNGGDGENRERKGEQKKKKDPPRRKRDPRGAMVA